MRPPKRSPWTIRFAEESLDFVDVITSPATHQSLVHLAAKHRVHMMDVARFLFGEAESVFCRIQQVNPSISGEDVATVMLSMQDGSTVIIELSYASRSERVRFPETYVFIEGAQGSVELAPDYWLRVTTSDGTHVRRVPPSHYEWANPATNRCRCNSAKLTFRRCDLI